MKDMDSFEAKVNRILKSKPLSKKSTKELIDNISPSSKLDLYFDQLPRSPKHKRLLFLHRSDLFGLEDEMLIPYLRLCSIPESKSDEKVTRNESKALQYFVSKELEKDTQELFKIMFDDKSQLDAFLEDFNDVIAYFFILFIRSSSNLKKLIHDENFDYKKMKDVLRNYQDIIDSEAFNNEIESAFKSGKSEIDPIIKSKVEKIVLQLLSKYVKNREEFFENTQKMMPDVIMPFHLISKLWLNNVLKKSGLSFKDYLDILNELHRNELIKNQNTIFWCESCNLESPLYSEQHGRIAPSKTTSTKCLSCDRTQSHASIYSLDSTIKDSIFSKDGLLAVYFGWLLKKEGIEFNESSYSGKYENDFVIKKSILVECKMFKLNKDLGAKRSEMISGFSQIEKHIEQLNSKGTEIKQAYLLWNRRDNEKALQTKLHSEHKELFEKYKLKIICPDEIEETIKEMKENH